MYSLYNWTTQLDLICEEPYKIGLIGAIFYLSSSLGSFLFTNLADRRGRKFVLKGACFVCVSGILFLILCPLNIYIIYAVLFFVGMSYNPRNSISYLFASEFLETKNKLWIGQAVFLVSGVIQTLSALWFWYFKSQTSYFWFLLILVTSSLLFVMFFVPESPPYLLARKDFDGL